MYYTSPFRDEILSYPQRSTAESINNAAATAPPRPKYNPNLNKANPQQPNRTASGGQPGQQKPEDKDSPEYKKKQALLAGPLLNMSYHNASSYTMSENLYSSVKDIFEAVVSNLSRSGIISPYRLVEVLKRDNEMFRGALHQDAHEFFNFLLNTILDTVDEHERKVEAERQSQPPQDVKDAQQILEEIKDDAVVSVEQVHETGTVSFPDILPVPKPSLSKTLRQMFEGTLTSETRCLSCENISHRDEPFLDLSVDLEQHTSVTSCLKKFSAEEMLCERDKFHCDNCGGLQEAEKRMKIKTLPSILTLHLKRFRFTEDFQRLQKLFYKVVYPYHIRLFNTTEEADDPDRLYELYAVVVHIGGGPMHGHYVSVVKTPDRGWMLYDDEMVEPVDRSFVQNFFGDKPGLATAYLLFYRETTIEAVREEEMRSRKRRQSQVAPVDDTVRPTEAADLHKVRSSSPFLSPHEAGEMASLDHAATAPPLQANGHVEPPRPPVASPPLGASAELLSKKEKSKAEKERKAAEKAAEKAARKEKEEQDRQARAQLHERMAEASRQNAEAMKWAMEDSKKMAKENEVVKKEDSKTGSVDDTTNENGASSKMSDNIFRRSKSLRFSSLGKKDRKPTFSTDEPLPKPIDPAALSSAVDDSENNHTAPDVPKEKEKENVKEKKSRFSLRKKSFNLLNS